MLCQVRSYPVCRGAVVMDSLRPTLLRLSRRQYGWQWGRAFSGAAGCGRGAGNNQRCSAVWDTSPGPAPPAFWAHTDKTREVVCDSVHTSTDHLLTYLWPSCCLPAAGDEFSQASICQVSAAPQVQWAQWAAASSQHTSHDVIVLNLQWQAAF